MVTKENANNVGKVCYSANHNKVHDTNDTSEPKNSILVQLNPSAGCSSCCSSYCSSNNNNKCCRRGGGPGTELLLREPPSLSECTAIHSGVLASSALL